MCNALRVIEMELVCLPATQRIVGTQHILLYRSMTHIQRTKELST